MAQSLSKMWTHLIFSTKDRYPFLSEKTIRGQLHAYMASILRNHEPYEVEYDERYVWD